MSLRGHIGKGKKAGASINFGHMSSFGITCCKKIGYNMDNMRQIAFMAVNPIMVENSGPQTK